MYSQGRSHNSLSGQVEFIPRIIVRPINTLE